MTKLIPLSTVLLLAIGMTSSAMASGHKATHHVGRFHTAASSKGPADTENQPAFGGFVSLGPLGITAACATYPRGQRGYCGPSNGAPIDAWSY